MNIIHSNYFKDKKMQIRDKLKFQMSMGQTDTYVFQYFEGQRVYEWPFVKSYLKKGFSNELQFLLTIQGLRIGKGVKKLVTEY